MQLMWSQQVVLEQWGLQDTGWDGVMPNTNRSLTES